MTRRTAMAATLLVALGAGCAGAAQQTRLAEEESAGDGAPPPDTGGDDAMTSTTAAGGEAPAQPTEPEPMVTTSEEWDTLLAADAALYESLQLAEPDCGAASEHLERLCDLAERICAIADDTGDPGARDRCTDGTARCERGRSALAEACD